MLFRSPTMRALLARSSVKKVGFGQVWCKAANLLLACFASAVSAMRASGERHVRAKAAGRLKSNERQPIRYSSIADPPMRIRYIEFAGSWTFGMDASGFDRRREVSVGMRSSRASAKTASKKVEIGRAKVKNCQLAFCLFLAERVRGSTVPALPAAEHQGEQHAGSQT